jgi:hypothetical protein
VADDGLEIRGEEGHGGFLPARERGQARQREIHAVEDVRLGVPAGWPFTSM